MLDLVFVIMLAFWAAGVGLWVMNRLRAAPENVWDSLALAIPIGLGMLALAVLGLGEVGALDPKGIESVLGIGAIVGATGAIRLLREVVTALLAFRIPTGRADRVVALSLGVAIVGTLLTSLAPVTDGDALCYHLQVPKLFLERGAAFYDPDLHETVYPLLTEMLYAVALAFRGPVACRLIQWLFGLVFAMNVTSLARPSLGSRAWWAGTIALLVPAVNNGMSAPLNDVALACYGAAAVLAWTRFDEQPSLRAAVLTGLLCGLALGVKYPALVLGGLIGLAIGPGMFTRTLMRFAPGGRVLPVVYGKVAERWATAGLGHRRWHRAHALAFVAAAWLAGGCWYARAFVHTGNPVYPFFRQTFGGAGLDEVLAPEKRPLEATAWNLATALGPLTLEPARFDSFSHQFGPVFLLFLPALFLERPPRRVLMLAALGYGFLVICLTQRQSTRFLLIAIGPLSVAVAWLANAWWERKTWPSRALVSTLAMVLIFESMLAAARSRHGLGVVAGLESPQDFLARKEPTFVVGQWVGENLAAGARLVGQDHRGFYIPRSYTMELAHRRRTGLGRSGESPEGVVEQLRRDGFTHVMMCPPEPLDAVEFDPTLGRLLGPWLAARAPIYQQVLKDGDGVARSYSIYPLDEPRLATTGRTTR